MEQLRRSPSRAVIKVCGHFLLSSLFLMRLCTISAEECREIVQSGGLSVQQAFFPSKIQIHKQCENLRENLTDVCSQNCNAAIEEFFLNLGGEDGRVFFTCECTEDNDIYPPEECAIDREKLVICPALEFLLQNDDFLTSTEAQEDTSPSKATTTKETVSTKPIIQPEKSCRKARQDCSKTLPCAKAFHAVKDFCLHDFVNGSQCSVDCRKAMDRLDMFPSAEGLWGCGCDPDGDEINWCRMYGRQGLRKTCEGVKYKELNTATSKENKDLNFRDDPGNSGNRHMVVSFLAHLIPVFLVIVVL